MTRDGLDETELNGNGHRLYIIIVIFYHLMSSSITMQLL